MTINLSLLLLVCSLTALTSVDSQNRNSEVDLSEFFNEYHVMGSFILFDKKKTKFTRYNKERCSEQFTPASTFKIPNSIIAIEEHIVDDASTIIKWDAIASRNPLWNKDMTLKEAFRVSCVPCYIRIANRVGEVRYQQYLEKFKYGNRSTTVISDDPDMKIAFWLIGDLKISQEEQIAFLRKLYDNELPVSKRSIDITKEILVDEKTNDYVLSGKLGRGTDTKNKREIGWYVGYVEKNDNVYFFATNFESADPLDNFGQARKEITLKILRKLNAI